MSNEAILKEFMQYIWNEKHFERIPEYLAEDYTIHADHADPWEGKTIDQEEFRKRLDFSFDSFPDMHFEITSAIPDGNLVAVTWIMTGTNTGKIGGYPPTNKKIETSGMTFYYFRDEKICGHSQVYDRTTVMKQLGFIVE